MWNHNLDAVIFLPDDFSTTHAEYSDVTDGGLKWTQMPVNEFSKEECSAQGVLEITPPDWAKSGAVYLKFAPLEEREDWMFNLGDSQKNDGTGMSIYQYIY